MGLTEDWGRLLRDEAAAYARVALTNIRREFPSAVWHTMKAPGDFPFRPKVRTPVFYGSFDWHSCVEMHWLLVRLLRVDADAVPANEIRAVLGGHFARIALAAEAAFVVSPDGLGERPYGWGWALMLIHETATWDDPAWPEVGGRDGAAGRRARAAFSSNGCPRRPTRCATGCTPTARSGCRWRCPTR